MSTFDSVPTWLRMTLGTAVPDVYKLEERAFEQVQKRPGLGRRAFLQSMTVAAGGLVVDPGKLIWTPTKRKNIILPVAASEQVVGVVEAHGTRYYMRLDAHYRDVSHPYNTSQPYVGAHRHLFFDSGWRLLHTVEPDYGSGWAAMPQVTPEQAMRMMAQIGKTPIELGQMACQKHHGIYDNGPFTGTYDGNTLLSRARSVPDFTVTEVAERLPSPIPGLVNTKRFGPIEIAPLQRFRDLTPEETVRLVSQRESEGVGGRLRSAAERLREQRRRGLDDELPSIQWTINRV